MAVNPMQRKARNSFLLGMVVTLLISAVIIMLLILKIGTLSQEVNVEKGTVYVSASEIKSGEIVTSGMFVPIEMDITLIPSNAITNITDIDNYFLEDINGNQILRNANGLYMQSGQNQITLFQEGEKIYRLVNNEKVYLTLTSSPSLAKIDMGINSIITYDMISKSEEKVTNDLRLQEFNMLTLPTQLAVDDYIDIRLMLPNGNDYIVISKKRVIDCDADTVWIYLSEDEIVTISNAIVEAYKITGSNLYATNYVEPGMQASATPTYQVSPEVGNAISRNPNIVEEARQALYARYATMQEDRNNIQNVMSGIDAETQNENVQTKVESQVTKSKEKRAEYIQGLQAQQNLQSLETE